MQGYSSGGKTGTAEKLPRGNGKYLVSFIGFAGLEKPEALVYVAIDQPHVEDQPHSSYASGVFAQIMKDILPYLNVFPVTDVEETADGENQLPVEEGIISSEDETADGETAEGGTEEAGETQDYPDEEYVPQDAGGSGIPANLPGQETQESKEETSEAGGDTGESGSTAQ